MVEVSAEVLGLLVAALRDTATAFSELAGSPAVQQTHAAAAAESLRRAADALGSAGPA